MPKPIFEFYPLVAAGLFGLVLGNLIGDQATIKDCATKGTANMAGGGTVKCEVERATLPQQTGDTTK